MFGLTILEIMYIVTTIMAGVMMIIYLEEVFNQMDKSFIKLKEERKTLESKVQSLEKELNKASLLSESTSEEEPSFHPNGRPTAREINKTLVNENKKLHVRCDMLAEELCKLREQNEGNNEIENKYSFRLFREKKIM
jgi:hypothetical protein